MNLCSGLGVSSAASERASVTAIWSLPGIGLLAISWAGQQTSHMSAQRQLVAGVDCSTQSTKVVVVDPADGRILATGRGSHEVTGTGGARETDPAVWWEALRTALAQTGRAGEVGAISVAGQQHGLVVADEEGRPLRPAVLWNDTRSAPDAAELRDRLGAEAWAERVGLVPVASFTVTRWAWLRRTEPNVAQATRAIRLPHDWLTERLCGRGATDRGDASGTGWWSTRDEDYRRRGARDAGGRARPVHAAGGARTGRVRRVAFIPRRPRGSACPRARWSAPAPATTWVPRSASASLRVSRRSASAPRALRTRR